MIVGLAPKGFADEPAPRSSMSTNQNGNKNSEVKNKGTVMKSRQQKQQSHNKRTHNKKHIPFNHESSVWKEEEGRTSS
jgi:hypothetical protein